MARSTPNNGRLLSVRHSLLAMLGLCSVAVLIAIDQTVVSTALPTIVAELEGFELYAWVASAYLLTAVVTVPIFGRLGDFYGRKYFIIASVLVFSAASLVCSMAQSMLQLVLARGLQGVGGGMLLGTVFACVPDLFPDPRVRLRWQVLLSASYGIASGIGPTLGGVLTQSMGWRAVFYVNLPIGFVGLFMIWRYLPHIRQFSAPRIVLDWQGAVLVTIGLSCLQLFVEFVPREGLSFSVLMLGALAALSLVLLVRWEGRCEQPLIPMSMMHDRSLVTLFILSLLVGCLMFVLLFYAPLMLQGGFGLSPREVGLAITPLVVFMTIGSIVNGRVVTRLRRPNDMLYAGFALLLACIVGLVFTSRNTAGWVLAGLMMVGGLGLGFVVPNLTVFAQQVAGRRLLGISTAVLQSTRMIGGMLGVALVGSLVSSDYVSRVRDGLAARGGQGSWTRLLEDPQLLVSQDERRAFVELLGSLSLDGLSLVEMARQALVGAVHTGLAASVLIGIVATLWVSRLPRVDLSSAPGEPAAAGKDGPGE